MAKSEKRESEKSYFIFQKCIKNVSSNLENIYFDQFVKHMYNEFLVKI